MKSAAFLAAALAIAAPAHAQMVTAANPQTIVAALQAGGYKATVGKDSTGDPQIRSAASGSNFVVSFYGCENNRACKTVTFYACLLYTSPSPRDQRGSRMPSSA